jgi:hypothetical protein
MTTDNKDKLDLTTPPTEQEVSTWLDSLNENDRQAVRQHQLLNAAVNKKTDDVDWARLNDAQFLAERLKRFGF